MVVRPKWLFQSEREKKGPALILASPLLGAMVGTEIKVPEQMPRVKRGLSPSAFPSGSPDLSPTSRKSIVHLGGADLGSLIRETKCLGNPSEYDCHGTDTQQTSSEGTSWLCCHHQTHSISNAGHNPNKKPKLQKMGCFRIQTK